MESAPLTQQSIVQQIRAAGFHPQRLNMGVEGDGPRTRLGIEDWSEFCDTARALSIPVVFFEGEPFTGEDFPPIGGQQRPLWDVLPEAAWLKEHVGQVPTVIYYAFFVGGVLEYQEETEWWNNTEGLWEKANAAAQEQGRDEWQRQRDEFEAELRRTLPLDEEFRQIALLPRPPMTAMRDRIQTLFPKAFVGGLYVVLNEVVKSIKAEEKLKRKAK